VRGFCVARSALGRSGSIRSCKVVGGSVCGIGKNRKTHQCRNHQKCEDDGKYNKAHKGLSRMTADDC